MKCIVCEYTIVYICTGLLLRCCFTDRDTLFNCDRFKFLNNCSNNTKYFTVYNTENILINPQNKITQLTKIFKGKNVKSLQNQNKIYISR